MEDVRGRGIGRQLLTELDRHARDQGSRRVRLTAGNEQPEALLVVIKIT